MAEDTSLKWEIEEIPDEDQLFLRVHINLLRSREDFSHVKVPMNIFRIHGDGMSANWNRYPNPEKTLQEAKEPEKNGVIKMNVSNVRNITPLKVKHVPIPNNRAHTIVCNIPSKRAKKLKVRSKLAEISSWLILPEVKN